MDQILHFTHVLLHLNLYLSAFVAQYGAWIYGLLFVIIFCVTGIVVMAILPGDSLLFASGAVAASGKLNIYFLMIIFISAVFLGNMLNYWVGNKLSHFLFKDNKARFFKQEYLDRAHKFYEKHGAKAIILGLFLPIFRTFIPFVAGMAKMTHFRFQLFNFLGAIIWVSVVLSASYFFGNILWVKQHFSAVIIAIIIVSVLPAFIEYLRVKQRKKSLKSQ